jgi:DNA invertase Pin-like site-specific DNA recombinase
METKVPFVAADRPTASSFEIHIYAAMAEEERRKISQRTRAALAVKKIQLAKEGRKLGNPNPLKALALANAAKRRATPPVEVLTMMRGWRNDKKSLRAIAQELSRLGIRTGRGSQWWASTVRLQLKAAGETIDE